MTSLIEEMFAAGRGMVALLLGRRDAPSYFDLTARGLAGSFVAFLLATAVNAYLPGLMGLTPEDSLTSWQAFYIALFFFSLQIGFSGLVLVQIKRLDGLMPYLVADNWASFFVTILSILLTLAGMASEMALVMLAIPVIIIEVNIARLIVTLSVLQIVSFLVAQLIGVIIGVLVLGMILPAPVV